MLTLTKKYDRGGPTPEDKKFLKEHIIVARSPHSFKKEEEKLKYPTIPASVKPFMPISQQRVVKQNIKEFQDVLEHLEGIITKMPATYETEEIPQEEKVAYLHYFHGGSDWYIFEKDKGDTANNDFEQNQMFGYSILGGDMQNAEFGYISMQEINQTAVELDFHFTPITFAELLKKHEPKPASPDQPLTGEFVYGTDYGVPPSSGQLIITELVEVHGYTIEKEGKNSFIIRDPRTERYAKYMIHDNGGEFNIEEMQGGKWEYRYSLPYDTNDGIILASVLAQNIHDLIQKGVTLEYPEETEFKEVLRHKTKEYNYFVSTNGRVVVIQPFHTGSGTRGEAVTIPINELATIKMNEDLRTAILKKIKTSSKENEFQPSVSVKSGDIVILRADDSTVNLTDYTKFFFVDDVKVIEETDMRTKAKKDLTFLKLVNKRTPQTIHSIARERVYLLNEDDIKNLLSPKLIDAIKGDNTVESVSINELVNGKNQHEINELIRSLIKKNGAERNKYSPQELQLLEYYEGSGGLAKEGEAGARLLDQFFTPNEIIKKMWGLAFKHGFTFKDANILEPSVGSGRFLKFIPENEIDNVVTFEVDETAHTICKLLFPKFTHHLDSFESVFFNGKRHVGLAGIEKFYDLVIGNPPYREYVSKYSPLGEREATGASTFDQYFIMRGVDVLKPGGLLIFIIPSSFMNNKAKYNGFKEKLAEKADLLEAFRLPSGIFGTTDVTTDILVLIKK